MLCWEESRDLLHGAFLGKRHRPSPKLNITHGLAFTKFFYGAVRLTPRIQLIYLYLIYRGEIPLSWPYPKNRAYDFLGDLQGTDKILNIREAMTVHVILDAIDNLRGHGRIHEVVRTDFDG